MPQFNPGHCLTPAFPLPHTTHRAVLGSTKTASTLPLSASTAATVQPWSLPDTCFPSPSLHPQSSAGFYQDSEHAAAVSEHYRHGPIKRFFEARKGDRDTWGVFDNSFSAGQNKVG